jgi:AraC-like DNA-binding protein
MFGFGRRPLGAVTVWDEQADLTETMTVIDEFMVQNKPFLQIQYSVYQLSEETGISLSDLSVILECYEYACFKDFVDHYRIAYCKEMIEKLPLQAINLPDLTVICGFSDQQEFCAAFKRAANVSVTRYIWNAFRDHLYGRLPPTASPIP